VTIRWRAQNSDPRITFDIGEASSLPYPSGHFDRAVSQLVLQFLSDPYPAVAEMRRAFFARVPTRYMIAEGKSLKAAYQWIAKSRWRKPPLDRPFGEYGRSLYCAKRKADLDDFNELWADLLTGRYEDDSNVIVFHQPKTSNKQRA
jgi:SAM-dependent methyltransferase